VDQHSPGHKRGQTEKSEAGKTRVRLRSPAGLPQIALLSGEQQVGKRYERRGSPQYSRRTINVRVKAAPFRKGYVAEREDVGRPGIGPKLIPIIEKGSLSKHGYSTKKSEVARRRALKKAIKEYGALSVYRKLKAMQTLRKRTQPEAREVFASDAEYVRSQHKTDGFVS